MRKLESRNIIEERGRVRYRYIERGVEKEVDTI